MEGPPTGPSHSGKNLFRDRPITLYYEIFGESVSFEEGGQELVGLSTVYSLFIKKMILIEDPRMRFGNYSIQTL